METIKIIGIGMGNPDTLTLEGIRAIEESQIIIGARRMVDAVCHAWETGEMSVTGRYEFFADFSTAGQRKKERVYLTAPEQILESIDGYMQKCSKERDGRNSNDTDPAIAVVVSGDVGFFSGAKKLVLLLKEKYEVALIPGISSLSYFCAKLQMPWEDVKVLSLHGRDANLIGEIQHQRKLFLLTDGTHTPAEICSVLTDCGMGAIRISVGERLSYEDEKITCGTAEELQHQVFDPLSVVLAENPHPIRPEIVTHGIADDRFIRGSVPMTKSEVRSVSLSKLQIKKEDILYDIGAGTGSVSVELALQAQKGRVYAVERDAEGCSLIEANKAQFGASNLQLVRGTAPDALEDLPAPDKVFIGGSKGNMTEILDVVLRKNPAVRIVINVIALESLTDVLTAVRQCGLELLDVTQISAAKAKAAGRYHLMMGQNPVYILTAQKTE